MIKRILWEMAVNTIASSKFVHRKIRYYIYKGFGIDIRSNKVRSGITFRTSKISIGEGTFINQDVFFDSGAQITIGKNVAIAFQTFFCTSTHKIGDEHKRMGKTYSLPITIEDGVWIGARVLILPGVTVGKGCIIAAGSVVNKDCMPNGIYAGVPAKRIKDID